MVLIFGRLLRPQLSSAWWGMIRECERMQLNAVLNRAKIQRFLSLQHPSFSEICHNADHQFFQAVLHNPDHVLRQLLSPVKVKNYNLRERVQDQEIPKNLNFLFKKTFIMEMNYLGIYWTLELISIWNHISNFHAVYICMCVCLMMYDWLMMYISFFFIMLYLIINVCICHAINKALLTYFTKSWCTDLSLENHK